MRAIVISNPGGPEVLALRDVEAPLPGPGSVRVRVRACGVNRADLLQRAGRYPAPPGAPKDIPGLEFAGEVEAVGDGVEAFALGTRVFGIVSGGAYAEYVTVHARELARMPAGLDFVQAASIPEAFVTAYDAMVLQGELAAGDAVLIHAVGSGVGSAAVQIARVVGARSLGTARSAQKLALAKPLGLDAGIVPGTHEGAVSFAKEVLARTDGQGVDVVLDLVGGAYVPESLAALREKGRLVLVGLLAGARAELDLGLVLRRRLTIRGTVMRARPLEEKIAAAQVLERRLAPLFASGALRAVVDRVLPLESAAEAHAYVASNETFGKVVLTV